MDRSTPFQPRFDRETVLAALKHRRKTWIGAISPGLIVPPLFYPTRALLKQLGTMGDDEKRPRNE